MLLNGILVILGLVALAAAADRFVAGAAALARDLNLSPLVVGMVVMGFGTSAPELMVSASAALSGSVDIAIGNPVGSNITNLSLVLGGGAVVAPIAVSSPRWRREYGLMLLALVLGSLALVDLSLAQVDGVVLLLGLAVVVWATLDRETATVLGRAPEELHDDEPQLSLPRALLQTAAALVILTLSAQLLVYGAGEIARTLGVSDLVIGLTLVAVGTSLEEFATVVASALKRQPDLALGNVVGSSIFNMLAVLALPALLAPGAVPPALGTRDLPLMLALALALGLLSGGLRLKRRLPWLPPARNGAAGVPCIRRPAGLALLLVFAGYQAYLFACAVE